jgi:type IV fimbrial biogenesis protein FimT
MTAGMTLTELMIALLIGAILMTIGIPSYRYITYSSRVSSEVNGLLGDLQWARSEAIREGQTVTVCPADAAQAQCVTNSNTWQNGWIIFSDINNDAKVANATDILRVSPAFRSSPQDTFLSDNGLSFVSFNREGFAAAFPPTATGYVTIKLHTTPVGTPWVRCLQIFSTGAMSTERANDPQGNCT